MTSFSSFQVDSKKAADSLLSHAPSEVAKLQSTFAALFAMEPLSKTRQSFASCNGSKNSALEEALSQTLDAVDGTLTSINAIERYIHLTLPEAEEGHNFGVSVQMQALKHIGDLQDKLQKQLEELSKYSATRADAVEKCKLPSISSTTTTTKTESENSGKDKEKGDTGSQSSSQVTEQKQVESKATVAEAVHRQDAVVAVDVLYYSKAKNLFHLALTSYMSVLDFCDKNKDKLAQPKGKNGSSSVFQSMY